MQSEFDEIVWQPDPSLAILDGTTLVEVEPPLDAEPYRQAYTVDDEGFVTITIGAGGLVHMHRSQDGREWREIDVIGDDADGPRGNEVHAWGGTVRLWGSAGDWTLTDGLVWEPNPDEGSPIGSGRIVGPMNMAGNPVFHPTRGCQWRSTSQRHASTSATAEEAGMAS